MKPDRPAQVELAPAGLWFGLIGFAVCVMVYGAIRVYSLLDWVCLASITAAALLAPALWLRIWRNTMPIFPLFCVMHVFNFALPFASGSSAVSDYDTEVKTAGALLIVIFLLLATIAWATVLLLFPVGKRDSEEYGVNAVQRLLPYGLAVPAVFTWFSLSGDLGAIGDLFSVARAVFGNMFHVAGYLFGVLWGSRRLSRKMLLIGIVALAVNTVLLWATLYLYAGVFALIAVLVGYTFGSGRIPVTAVLVVLAVTTVLHAGKGSMRERYWGEFADASYSVTRIPQFMTEWAGEGVSALFAERGEASYLLSDRVGLMHMLLRAQQFTPDAVPYLEGETYAMIPRMLVPRFIDPDKPSPRDTSVLLNVRYGVQTFDDTEVTTIGWGVLAEAYANFGSLGGAGLGILLGALFGFITLTTSGAPPLSTRTLFGIIVLVTAMNLEGDMSQFATIMLQGFIAALILIGVVRMSQKVDSRQRPAVRHAPR